MADALFNASLKIDTSQFEAALHDYARFSKRTLPEIMASKLGSWAYEIAKTVPMANAARIRDTWQALGQTWWKFVNTVVNRKGYTIKGRRKTTEAEAAVGYIDLSTRMPMARRGTISTFRNTRDTRKRGDYVRVSKSILRRRAARAKAMRALFLWVAHGLGRNVTQVGDKNSWKFHGITIRKSPNGTVNPSAAFSIPFRAFVLENRSNVSERDQRENQKVSIAMPHVLMARDRVIADTRQETARRYAKQAAAISRRGGW
jgi:hypothetical protein